MVMFMTQADNYIGLVFVNLGCISYFLYLNE
jgi:hypothetical protein